MENKIKDSKERSIIQHGISDNLARIKLLDLI